MKKNNFKKGNMKKGNIKRILTIVIIIVILLLAFLWVFFNTDIFRTKRSTFHKYLGTSLDFIDVLEKQNNDFSKYYEKKENTSYIRKGSASIESSSNVADSNILDKIKITVNERSDNPNEKRNADISINNGDDNLETISLVQNKDIYGISCKDVVTGYVCVKNEDLARIAKDIGFNKFEIANETNKINLSKLLETSKVEQSKIDKLSDTIVENITPTKYEKEKKKKVKIEDKTYTTTAYTVSLNSEESANLQIGLLTKISQDSILMDYITSKLKLLNVGEDYTSINELNGILKQRITELRTNSSKANNLKITLCEYKQKNIRTEIQYGENKFIITHLVDGDNELSAVTIGNETYGLQKKDGKYILSYVNNNDTTSISAEYNQTGSVDDNNIKNFITLIKKDGIKSITYKYEDSVEFTNDIGTIKDFSNQTSATLNDFSDDEIKQFISLIKDKINQVYINKGASIGINLDPIFTEE